MTSLAINSFGTLFQVSDGGSTPVFTTIAEVRDIGGPNLEQSTTEVTPHDGTRWRQFIATLKSGGQVTIVLNYVPTHATHDASTGLLKAYNDGTLGDYKVIFPDADNTEWAFSAIVVNFSPTMPVEGVLGANVTFQTSGDVTLA